MVDAVQSSSKHSITRWRLMDDHLMKGHPMSGQLTNTKGDDKAQSVTIIILHYK